MVNDFVPFCNENTGTNLPAQAAYIANPNLPIGNQPGIASSSFVNKALRQATTIAAIVAQYTANVTGADMLDNQNTADHANPAALLAALTSALKVQPPVVTKYTASTGNHNLTYKFQIASGSATAGATYSDGTTTYTVKTTVASGTQLDASGNAIPVGVAGTLTKTGGTGDTTITYYAYRMPVYLRVRLVGGGGGGGGSGAGAGAGGAGTGSSFGSSLLACNGGTGGGTSGGAGGAGGSASLGTGPVGLAYTGGTGNYGTTSNLNIAAGFGGVSPFGGGGAGGAPGANGGGGQTNTGSGGAGAPGNAASYGAAGGGGAGGYVDAIITSPLSVYPYTVGAAGASGTAGTGGTGGAGAAGLVIVEEHYQ